VRRGALTCPALSASKYFLRDNPAVRTRAQDRYLRVFVDEFPMTPSGKVQKFVLRERFVAGGEPAPEQSGQPSPAA